MLLEVRDLHVSYGDIEAVHGISFFIDNGELVSIIGANGAGKTTTLRALMGLQPIKSGSVLFDGVDITSLPAHKRAHLGIRMVPERARCFPQLSVYENLLMGVYGKPASLKQELAYIYELFPILNERSKQSASTLSGGEQQRAAACRALVNHPKMILADEPTGNLDSKSGKDLLNLLSHINTEYKATILMVTHDVFAASYCDKILFIRDGEIYNELHSGNDKKQFFDSIIDVMSMLGGERK